MCARSRIDGYWLIGAAVQRRQIFAAVRLRYFWHFRTQWWAAAVNLAPRLLENNGKMRDNAIGSVVIRCWWRTQRLSHRPCSLHFTIDFIAERPVVVVRLSRGVSVPRHPSLFYRLTVTPDRVVSEMTSLLGGNSILHIANRLGGLKKEVSAEGAWWFGYCSSDIHRISEISSGVEAGRVSLARQLGPCEWLGRSSKGEGAWHLTIHILRGWDYLVWIKNKKIVIETIPPKNVTYKNHQSEDICVFTVVFLYR